MSAGPRVVPRVIPAAGQGPIVIPGAAAGRVSAPPGLGPAVLGVAGQRVAVPSRAPGYGTTPSTFTLPAKHALRSFASAPAAVSQGATACEARVEHVNSLLQGRGGMVSYEEILRLVPGVTLRELRKMNAQGADFEVTFDGTDWQVRPKGAAAQSGIREAIDKLGGSAPVEEIRRAFNVSRQDLRDQGYVVYVDKARGGASFVGLPDAPREPGEALEQEILEKLINLISDAGGALPLGYVNKQIPGLKKHQLVQHFEVNETDKNGNFEVRIPGATCEMAAYMVNGRPCSEQDPDLEMAEDLLGELANWIVRHGGKVFIDDVFLNFPDVKKPQLRQKFSITRRNIKNWDRNGNTEQDLKELVSRGINLTGRKEVYEVRLKEGTEYPGIGVFDPDDPLQKGKDHGAKSDSWGESRAEWGKSKGKGKGKETSPYAKGKGKEVSDYGHGKGKGKDKSGYDGEDDWSSAPDDGTGAGGWGNPFEASNPFEAMQKQMMSTMAMMTQAMTGGSGAMGNGWGKGEWDDSEGKGAMGNGWGKGDWDEMESYGKGKGYGDAPAGRYHPAYGGGY